MAQKKKSYRYQSKAGKIIADEFQTAINVSRKVAGKSHPPKFFSLNGEVLKRRKHATEAYLETAREKFEKKYPVPDFTLEWATFCSAPGYSADGVDILYTTSMGAAIWILDELEKRFLVNEIMQYLPDETAPLPDQYMFWEPHYDAAVLQKMLYLIRNRDNPTDSSQWSFNDIAAHRHEPELWEKREYRDDMTNRERLNAILSYLSPKRVESASGRFENKIWEFSERYFETLSYYWEEENRHRDRSNELYKKYQMAVQTADVSEASKQQKPSSVLTPNPLLNTSQKFDLPEISVSKFGNRNKLEEMTRIGLMEEKTIDIMEERRSRLLLTGHMLQTFDGKQRRQWIENQGEKAYDIISSFTVDDPYETCFAYLSALDSGSDLPWLYAPTVAVLTAAAMKLPWTGDPFFNEYLFDDEDLYEEDPEDDEDEEDYDDEDDYDDDCLIADIEPDSAETLRRKAELYELKYSPDAICFPDECPAPARPVNLPQIIYGITGTVMPRTVIRTEKAEESLIKSGIPSGEVKFWEMYIALANEVLSRVDPYDYQWKPEEESFEEEEPEEPGSEPADSEALQARITALESQTRELRQKLYDANRAVESKQSEINRVLEDTAREHQELVDLRELVFNLEAETEPELENRREIEFPYNVRRRTIIFGGHDTWVKAIRPMLSNVQFVGRGVNPNADMIRRADVVWIQTNAIPHKHYNKIMDITRNHRIPVRYFGYASAEKCALQLAAADSDSVN